MEKTQELKNIRTKYATRCGACKGNIPEGMWVWWSPSEKAVLHTGCKDKKIKKKKQNNNVFGYVSSTGVRHMTPRL